MSLINNILEDHIKKNVPEDEVALLLSGGVDSLSLGFACDRLGKKVHAYTFKVGHWKSPDYEYSKMACEIFGWEWTEITLDPEVTERDILRLRDNYKCIKKTQYECAFPFLYIYPVIKQKSVLMGLGADGNYGLSRKAVHHMDCPNNQGNFEKFKTDNHESENHAGIRQQRLMAQENELNLIVPYMSEEVFQYFLHKTWKETNQPKQKIHVVLAYAEEFSKIKPRPHSNLQLNSGVDKIFLKLLKSDMNVNNRKRVMDLLRDLNNAV